MVSLPKALRVKFYRAYEPYEAVRIPMPEYLKREVIETLIREVKRLLDELKSAKVAENAIYSELKDLAGGIFEVASASGLNFEEAASMVIEAFGKEVASKLVSREDVERAYGFRNAEEWSRMIG